MTDYDRSSGGGFGDRAPARRADAFDDPYGRRALGATTDLAVQLDRGGLRGAAGAEAAADVHEAAARGTSGGSRALPYLDVIQRSFGRHDVSHVQAHTDDRAAEGAGAMGAAAYAVGDHVAFAGAPDLHTAAHEAAHVVQQQRGVHLAGGVGRDGDPYERHADAVADRVVRGESSEALLDEHVGGASVGAPPVQAKLRIRAGEGEDNVDGRLAARADGADRYIHAIFELLQQLAAPLGAKLHLAGAGDDKEVTVDALAAAEQAQTTPGFTLLQRVITSAHEVVVDPWKAEALNSVKDADISKAKNPNAGVGSTVEFPWKQLPQSVVRTADGANAMRDTPMAIALGHELIHADHAQRGVWRGDDKTLNHFDTGDGGQGDYAIAEEIDTVGLGGQRRAGDVTENDLRGQLGHEQRASYHQAAMFQVLKARAEEQEAEKAAEFQRLVEERNAWHQAMQAVWTAQAAARKGPGGGQGGSSSAAGSST